MSDIVSPSVFRRIRWARLNLTLEALDPIGLEGFIGPTLRGVLGEALHSAAWRDPETGVMDPGSLYRTVFEGPDPEPGKPKRPPPFLLHPPGPDGVRLDGGDSLTFGLTLVGDAVAAAPALCWYLFRFGINDGIGRQRSRFLLREVVALTPDGPLSIFRGSRGPVADQFLPAWCWNGEQFVTRAMEELPRGVGAVSMVLATPLDLRANGRPVSELTFRLLLRSVLRNLASHARNHGDGPLDLDFEAWKQRSSAVTKSADQTGPRRVLHFSRRQFDRQGRPRPIGVDTRIGMLTFTGDMDPFLPFLVMATAFHLGKGRTMGFGGVAFRAGG